MVNIILYALNLCIPSVQNPLVARKLSLVALSRQLVTGKKQTHHTLHHRLGMRMIHAKPQSDQAYEHSDHGKRTRTTITSSQLQVLYNVLQHTAFPSRLAREDLSRLLKLDQRTIQIWFQNQRQKARKRMVTAKTDVSNVHEQPSGYPIILPRPAEQQVACDWTKNVFADSLFPLAQAAEHDVVQNWAIFTPPCSGPPSPKIEKHL